MAKVDPLQSRTIANPVNPEIVDAPDSG